MMKKVDLSFQSCNNEYKESDVVIFSVPLDTTTSYRPGTRFAGNAIRVESIGIEWYSPYRNANLRSFKTVDTGDLSLPMGDVMTSMDIIYDYTKKILSDNKVPMMVGGEHLASYPVIKAAFEKYPNLHIIHLDAHTDLREEFLGMEFSHATFMRKVYKLLGDGKIYQLGMRSGDEKEFKWAKEGLVDAYKLDGGDLVLINSNFILDAGLKISDALILEEAKDNPYANILATIPEYQNTDKIKALVEVLKSEVVKNFIIEKWNGDIVPA